MGWHRDKITHKLLIKECTEFLNGETVEVVGVFDVHLNFAERVIAPTAAGVAGYAATRVIEEQTDHDGAGSMLVAAAVGLAAGAGTKHLMYMEAAKKQGLTPIMIVAITPTTIYLMDWKGTHEHGEGPKRVLFEFERSKETKIKVHHIHHLANIYHKHGHHAKIECKLGPFHHNKKMNKEVIEVLREH